MICKPCRKGGQANRLANEDGRGDIRTSLERLARRDHGRCEAPSTCPCHHFVGQVINKQPVKG